MRMAVKEGPEINELSRIIMEEKSGAGGCGGSGGVHGR